MLRRMAAGIAHSWLLISEHATSEGRVAYQRCACGSARVVLAGRALSAGTSGATASPSPTLSGTPDPEQVQLARRSSCEPSR